MEALSIQGLLKFIADFGTLGVVILLWWHDSRRFAEILGVYKKDMDEQRTMYDKNVELVKDYHSIESDLSSVVIMSTQAMTRLADEIRQNQYCPLVRIDKKQVIIGERHGNIDGKSSNAWEVGGGGK